MFHTRCMHASPYHLPLCLKQIKNKRKRRDKICNNIDNTSSPLIITKECAPTSLCFYIYVHTTKKDFPKKFDNQLGSLHVILLFCVWVPCFYRLLVAYLHKTKSLVGYIYIKSYVSIVMHKGACIFRSFSQLLIMMINFDLSIPCYKA